MKSKFLLICTFFLLATFSVAQRLPKLAVPENYKLTFTPDFTNNNFAGEETIKIKVLKPTSEIVLNSIDIDFHNVSITSDGKTQKAKVTTDKEKQMVTLAFENQLAAGPATISIKLTGILNDELRGFYLGHDEKGQKYAVTQFESTDARRAFPCFDEPAYKATFNITVVADKDMTVLSNSKVLTDSPGPGESKHTVHFATTPKMSSYLAAIAVGHFEYLEGSADGIPIRVYTMPGKKELATFALDAAEHIMQYYNRYFGIKYPYGKLDMLGLPDFAAGAMENTGLITYREVLLMLDDKHAAVTTKKEVASVIAHEMAHQWFGDLVTMQWWDDIWLNEGFATWMSSKPIEEWKPEWHFELDDAHDTTQSLNVDSLENTRPIHQAAETPAQIEELFDGIAYGKTAAVLRMLEAYLGPKTFEAGVNVYIKKHQYANATAADFWGDLAQASKKPVDKIMPTFVEQPGAPIVSVKTQCSGDAQTVSLEQQRYFYDRSKLEAGNTENNELWVIPVCLKDASNARDCRLFSKKEEQFTLKGCSPWVFANANAVGYYRTGYTSNDVLNLGKVVETALTPAERIMLLTDTWSSVRVGREPIGDFMALASRLQSDRNNAVLAELILRLQAISDDLVNDKDKQAFELWVHGLLSPAAKDVGWEPKPTDTDAQQELRARLLEALGNIAHDPEAQSMAHKLAEQALDNPGSVPQELATAALNVAAANGNADLYEKIQERMKSAKSPEQFYNRQRALARFSDPMLIDRTLQYAISPDVRSQDTGLLLGRVMVNPAASKQAWDFIQSHWPEVEKRGGPTVGVDIVQFSRAFCDAGLRDQVKDFFTAHKVPSAERKLKQSLEVINYCVDLKTQQSDQLAAWLGQHGSTLGE